MCTAKLGLVSGNEPTHSQCPNTKPHVFKKDNNTYIHPRNQFRYTTYVNAVKYTILNTSWKNYVNIITNSDSTNTISNKTLDVQTIIINYYQHSASSGSDSICFNLSNQLI